MRFFSRSSFGAQLKTLIAVVGLLWMNSSAAEDFKCPSGLLSFGTSLSDTGNVPFAYPGEKVSQNLPYGETFFGFNALRFSDGRLVVDYLDLAFGFPLLSPYMQSVAPDFRYGVNFAPDGATALPVSPQVPFHLAFQVKEFSMFKKTVQVARETTGVPKEATSLLPDDSLFSDGLYILSVFGRNDFAFAYLLHGFVPETAVTLIPKIVLAIVDGISDLYKDGARTFLVLNVPPQGCSPQFLSVFGPFVSETDYDEYGCLASYNHVDQVFNAQLKIAIDELRTALSEATILLFDYYEANMDVLRNPESYGFSSEVALEACCGIGNHNFNKDLVCTRTGTVNGETVTVKACSNPSEHISWDGVHFTDAFNGVIARKLLTGQHMDPPINMTAACNLDLNRFNVASFSEAYPNGYIITPKTSSSNSISFASPNAFAFEL